jgi:peptidoglycan/xylan/chitin deacetylase (PgdA/CDA1 family)
MNIRVYQPPKWLTALYSRAVWKVNEPENHRVLYLTFDDGPTAEHTEYILDLLKQYQAKGTFFCVGHNLDKHPDLHQLMLAEGHVVANHTYNHVNGFKTRYEDYMENIEKCNPLIDNNLFRPPYGLLTRKQYLSVIEKGYNIIMWTFLTYDFDSRTDFDKVIEELPKKISTGDIIVLHDNIKATKGLTMLLPFILEYFHHEGYVFEVLS